MFNKRWWSSKQRISTSSAVNPTDISWCLCAYSWGCNAKVFVYAYVYASVLCHVKYNHQRVLPAKKDLEIPESLQEPQRPCYHVSPSDPLWTSDDLSAWARKAPLPKARHSAICLPPPAGRPAVSASLPRPSASFPIMQCTSAPLCLPHLFIHDDISSRTPCFIMLHPPLFMKWQPPLHTNTLFLPCFNTHTHTPCEHSYTVSSAKHTHIYTFPAISSSERSMLSHSILFFLSVWGRRGYSSGFGFLPC